MKSVYNTPVVWSVYILNLVLKWIERQGGVEGVYMQVHSVLCPPDLYNDNWPHAHRLPLIAIICLPLYSTLPSLHTHLVMAQKCTTKSGMVFDVINQSSGFYSLPVEPSVRSRVNVPFRIVLGEGPSEELEAQFLREAEEQCLVQLKGHRSVGGLRASLYNAVSVEHTKRLTDFMLSFMERNRS